MSIACARGAERYFLQVSEPRLQPRLAFPVGWAKFLRIPPYDCDPGLHALANQHLFGGIFGCVAVREYPVGQERPGDVDSGQLVMGFGPSASGFAIAVTAIMDDLATGDQLLRSLALLGLEVREDDRLYYRQIPEVGQAMILFGRAELWKRANERAVAR